MKNFTKLTLTALTAVATLAPTANAQFTDQHGNTFYEPTDFDKNHAPIVERLYNVGIPVVDGRGTNLCQDENVLGWYTGEKNFIVICYGDETLRAETLAHEAVHVAQDCRAGLSNNSLAERENMGFIYEYLPAHKERNIVNNYDRSDWVIEAEAFYYEDEPTAVVAMLDQDCDAFRF